MLSCVYFTGKGRKTITVSNVRELILKKQEKKDEPRSFKLKKKKKKAFKIGD